MQPINTEARGCNHELLRTEGDMSVYQSTLYQRSKKNTSPFRRSFKGKLIDKPGLHLPVPTKSVRVERYAKAEAVWGKPVIVCPHCNRSGEAIPNNQWSGYGAETPRAISNGMVSALVELGYRYLWFKCKECQEVSYVSIEVDHRKPRTLGDRDVVFRIGGLDMIALEVMG